MGHVARKVKFEEGPGDFWLWVRGWNGKTLMATSDEANRDYAVLLTGSLRKTFAFIFKGRRIGRIRPNGTKGWVVELTRAKQVEIAYVGNGGAVRFAKAR